MARTVDVVLDGPPGPGTGRFVEVEIGRQSVACGTWAQDHANGRWRLCISKSDIVRALGHDGMARLVVIESPYAGNVEANLVYARRAMADSLRRGEMPFASHLLYTQPGILDDTIPAERALGMRAGFYWGDLADATVVYDDLGITAGMSEGIKRARLAGRPVERRSIGTT